MRHPRLRLAAPAAAAALSLVLLLTGCSTTYYAALEKVGLQKRELLADRVEGARDSQAAASEEFRDALQQFSALTGFTGGDLEAKYRELDGAYRDCESRAKDVRSRIDGVVSVAEALFAEWERELDQYSSPSLRAASEQRLRETRARYESLHTALDRAASRMDPVLAAFKDQVLFLKHNLNARAIASLDGTSAQLRRDIDQLVAEMQRAVAEAERFIATLRADS